MSQYKFLDQCLQKKAFETVYYKNVLLQFYSEVSLSEKGINNLIECKLIYMLCFFNPSLTFCFKMFISTKAGIVA